MVWRTDPSDRILEGAEAKVFAKALLNLLDEFDFCDFEYDLGIKCFDTLTVGQKISVLSTIGNGLFRKEVEIVELTAVLESGIGAVSNTCIPPFSTAFGTSFLVRKYSFYMSSHLILP